MTSDLVHNTLGRRADAQHGQTARIDLRPPGVLDHLGRKPQAPRFAHQLFHLVEALSLYGDFGLAEALPPRQELGSGAGGAGFARFAGEALVAG